MGSACSSNVVETDVKVKQKKKLNSSTASLRHLKRDDADEILVKAPIGCYVFSYDAAGEEFLSVSAGAYVCHHPILKHGALFVVGGEYFAGPNQFLEFFRTNPLGSVKLTKQFTENVTPVKRGSSTNNISPTRSSIEKKASINSTSNKNVASTQSTTQLTVVSSNISENQNGTKECKPAWKKSRKVSFKDFPPPDTINMMKNNVREHPSNFSISEVSSAGEKEHFLADEPIPVLPAPSGVRPPPLFQRFSMLAAEFAEPFDSNAIPDLKQLLFQLYKGNPRLKYTPRVNTVKLIVTGEADTYEERSYFLLQQFKKLNHWAQDHDFILEYIDPMMNYDRIHVENNASWVHEKIAMNVGNEIKICLDGHIPFILLVYNGHYQGRLATPKSFTEDQFINLTEALSKEDCQQLKQMYGKDENSIPCSYILNEKYETDSASITRLLEIAERLIMKEELDDNILECIVPGRDRHIQTVLQSSNPFVVFIERTFYDLPEHEGHPEYDLHDNNIHGNELIELKHKIRKLYEHLLLNNNLDEDEQFVTMETSFDCFMDDTGVSKHCQSFSNLVNDRLRVCITSMQQRLKAKTVNDFDYDEVLFHVLKSSQLMFDSTVSHESLEIMREYLQGSENAVLVASGPQSSGKTSLLSRAPTMAFDWFSGLCCIVYRQIGQTNDSTSQSLLLRSICLQLSYAYGTDPNAIPNDLFSIWHHFLRLIELATDSLPLVIILDGLDSICTTSLGQDLYSLISNELPPYVKVVVSVDSEKVEDIQSGNFKSLELLPFTEEQAFQYLDHMLVSKDRTLNPLQKDLVSNAISTNHEPVFVRMMMSEIEKWTSSTLETIPFSTYENAFEKLCQRTIERNAATQKNLDAFFYAISLDVIGIPKSVLKQFLERVHFHQEHFEIQSLFENLLVQFDCICLHKFISGLEIISLRDRCILSMLQKRAEKEEHHLRYFQYIKEFFLDVYHEANIMEQTSVVKQRLVLSEISFFHRVFLKHGTMAELKQFFLFNFDYLFAKLTCLSFDHLCDDVIVAKMTYSEDYELTVLSEIIELSREGLSTDSSQFPLQVIGRLNHKLLKSQNQNGSVTMEISKSHTTNERSLLYQLYTSTSSLCSVLKPNRACLIAPNILVKQDKEEQSQWTMKDLKVMFLNNNEDFDFVGWRSDAQEIIYFDQHCCSVKRSVFQGLNRILFALEENLVIETKLGVNVVYNMKDEMTLCSIHNNYDVIGTNLVSKVILMHYEMKHVKVIDTRAQRELWTYIPNIPFNNVCCSHNGRTALCFSDNQRMASVRRRADSSTSGESHIGEEEQFEETYEEITILDLKGCQKIRTVNLPTEASFSKLYLMSEDGLYFVRVTEPEMNILVWNLTTGNIESEIETNCCRIVRLAVSSVGNVVVTVSTDASIRVFNLNDGSLRCVFTEYIKSVRMDDQHCLTISPDGNVCVYFVRSNFHPSFVAVWNLCSGGRVASLTTDFYGLTYLISNDSRYIVSNFPSGIVRFDLSD